MGSLAEMALQRARQRLAGVDRPRKPVRPAAVATPAAKPKSMDLVVSGPINHFMFLEGRNWAIDMVASLRAAPAPVVIERLAGAAVGRPGSYAAGIQSVIKELRGGGQCLGRCCAPAMMAWRSTSTPRHRAKALATETGTGFSAPRATGETRMAG